MTKPSCQTARGEGEELHARQANNKGEDTFT